MAIKRHKDRSRMPHEGWSVPYSIHTLRRPTNSSID